MRKRLVIGAIAAVVIGVAAYVLSQPRKGTVEWHKDKFLAAAKGPGIMERVKGGIGVRFGKHPHDFATERLEHLREHRQALLTLGYLQKYDVVITNITEMSPYIWNTLQAQLKARIPADRMLLSSILRNGPRTLTVVAPREDIHVWAEVIRNFDARDRVY